MPSAIHEEYVVQSVPSSAAAVVAVETRPAVHDVRHSAAQPKPRITAERQRQLETTIRQRIESRLPRRLRNLVVRVNDHVVVLEGECATYYTKQLAQHAALGVLEDESLENAIVVSVPQ